MKISELSDEALLTEREHWNNEIKRIAGWGAALTAAAELREACDAEISRRKSLDETP